MARWCEELMDPKRYGKNLANADVILASANLLWPANDGEARGEEIPMSVALVDLKPSELSRAEMAMQAAAFMEGEVVIQSLKIKNWMEDLVGLAVSSKVSYLDWVVAAPGDTIGDLVQIKHVPGIGQAGLAGFCVVVTDRPELVDAGKFDLVVTAISDVGLTAGKIFRMLSTLTASYTVNCLDSAEIAETLNLGQDIQLITVYWDDSTQTLIFPSLSAKSRLAQARGVFWAGDFSLTDPDQSCYSKILKAIRQNCPDAEITFGVSGGQRADGLRWPLRAVDLLCAV